MTDTLSLRFVHLFPEAMNIYGDKGNVIALQRRCEWRGIAFEYQTVNTLKDFGNLSQGDFYFFGGGQDADQALVWSRILENKDSFISVISQAVEDNKVFLLVCGGYQLFGRSFLNSSGESIPGLGILDVETRSPGAHVSDRCIGNISIETTLPLNPKTIVGFENHGGQTYFCNESKRKMQYFGRVIKGFGNTLTSGYEGCLYKNIVGTYMHGSLLPKNPHLADYLISRALETRYGRKITLSPLDDDVEMSAHHSVLDALM